MILSFKLVQEPEEPNDDEEPASLAELSSVPFAIPDAGFKPGPSIVTLICAQPLFEHF